jgi:Protein of unknown function (DUF4238)
MKFNTRAADEKLPRYNHYVPRFILDNFALNGQLSIFDKHTLKRFRLPPYRAMGEKDFNKKARAEIQRAKNYYAMIKKERVTPIISENLLFLNSLQVRSSCRYLACRTDDFSFAVKSLSERPHWKEGAGIEVA